MYRCRQLLKRPEFIQGLTRASWVVIGSSLIMVDSPDLILKIKEILAQRSELQQNKYLNNLVEQDHRFIKKLVNKSLGFKSFHITRRTIIGYETMNIIRKEPLQGVAKGDVLGQVEFLSQIFGVAA